MLAMCIRLNMAASIVSLRLLLQILFLIKITSQLQYKWKLLNVHDKDNCTRDKDKCTRDKDNCTRDNKSFCNKNKC